MGQSKTVRTTSLPQDYGSAYIYAYAPSPRGKLVEGRPRPYLGTLPHRMIQTTVRCPVLHVIDCPLYLSPYAAPTRPSGREEFTGFSAKALVAFPVAVPLCTSVWS